MKNQYDIIISGAGIVGLACALALAKSPLKIAILEQTKAPAKTLDLSFYDRRVSAIHKGSQHFLTQIGAWGHIPQDRLATYEKMHVWDAVGRGTIDFDARDLAESDLGSILENRFLTQALLMALSHCNNVTLHYETALKSVQIEDCVILTTEKQDLLTASLLIGADGAHSKVRELMGIESTERSLEQHALVATVKTEKPHARVARQVFTPQGPLAFLPLPDPFLCSIVWSTTEVDQLMSLDRAAFATRLTQTFEECLGNVEVLDDPLSFPLFSRYATQYVQKHMALIGDAIHTIHPLAGQGLNLGLMDAECLAHEILTAQGKGRGVNDYLALRRYERARKGDNQLTLRMMEGFRYLFEPRQGPLAKLRSLGLNTVDQCKPLKHFFMKRAMRRGNKNN